MHADDQDVIDDFLLEIASRGLSLKGQFLEKLVALGVARCQNPNQQKVTELLPDELLRLAKAWKKEPKKVITTLECLVPESVASGSFDLSNPYGRASLKALWDKGCSAIGGSRFVRPLGAVAKLLPKSQAFLAGSPPSHAVVPGTETPGTAQYRGWLRSVRPGGVPGLKSQCPNVPANRNNGAARTRPNLH